MDTVNERDTGEPTEHTHTHAWFSPTMKNGWTFEIPDSALIILIINNEYHYWSTCCVSGISPLNCIH